MKIYVQKQIQTLYTPNNKKQSMKFNIIKQNDNKINHIHGETVDNKGQILKIKLKKYKITDFKTHIKNNDSYKLNSNEIYQIYDESKIKRKPLKTKTKTKPVDKKKKSSSKKSSKSTIVDKKKKTSSKKSSKTTIVDKKKKSLSSKPSKPIDKKPLLKKVKK